MVNKDRLVNSFIEMTKIDAISFQEREMADYLTTKLKELGFTVKEDQAGNQYGSKTGNLYCYREGTIEGRPLLFCVHMDTVAPGIGKKAVCHENGIITSDGSTVLGADDVSGIAELLEMLVVIRENAYACRSLELLITIGEEAYLKGSEVFDFSQIKAEEAFVLDLTGPAGTAAIEAPSLLPFTLTINGQASHAGFQPEAGIHAIAVAANIITAMKQGRIDEETTFNIGMISGGEGTNIVPKQCVLRGEARSLKHKKAEKLLKKLEKTTAKITQEAGAVYELAITYANLAYKVPKKEKVIKHYKQALKELGIEPDLIATFGGSDASNLMKHGIMTLTLSCGMEKVHTCEEYTLIEELIKNTEILLKLVQTK